MDESLIEDSFPLAPVQEGMLFNSLRSPGSCVDVVIASLDLEQEIDEALFLKAWQRAVDRHAALRTCFRWQGLEEPLQDVHRSVLQPTRHEDWSALAEDEKEARWRALDVRERGTPFDLARAPLTRLVTVRFRPGYHRVLWVCHHAVLDGLSMTRVLSQVVTDYRALELGEACSFEPSPPQRAYVDWVREQDTDASEAFWREHLLGMEAPTRLGIDRGDDEGDGEHEVGLCLSQDRWLSAPDTAALREWARAHGLSLSVVVQGAWAVLVGLYGGERKVVFGAVKSGRRSSIEGADGVMGVLLNTLPTVVDVDPGAEVIAWLARLQAHWIALRPHEHTPLVRIKEWSGIGGRQAPFESLVCFDALDATAALHALGGPSDRCKADIFTLPATPVSLNAYGGERLLLRIGYHARRFDHDAITRLLRHLETVLRAMVTGAARHVGELPILTPEEQREALARHGPAVARPPTATVHGLFEAQRARTPEAIAIGFEGAELTYDALDARANRLAACLRDKGVGPDVMVGLCVERGLDLPVGMLGILKAGGAYVPLDPAFPGERLSHALDDAAAPILVTQRRLLAALPGFRGEIVCLDDDLPAPREGRSIAALAGPDHLAYVIHTSGSTGRPKGVQIVHGAVVNLLLSMAREPGLRPDDVLLAVTTLSFDIAVLELLLPLCVGARVEIASREVAGDGLLLRQKLSATGITAMQATPATWRMLIDAGWRGDGQLKMLCGGEELPWPLARDLLQRGGELWNLYGPTETTIWSAAGRVQIPEGPAAEGPVEIGEPITNTSFCVLDDARRLVPRGVPGELYIGGSGLARGYLNQPALTAERFLSSPWPDAIPGRLYRTGDRVRRGADGRLAFLGRVDRQIKLRGFRIELGEIESALRRGPEVGEAVALLREDAPGDKRLVAYVVPAGSDGCDIDALRRFLRTLLPDHMIPSAFVLLERLPLSPNGKVDRRALPAPAASRAGAEHVAPRTPIETAIAEMWIDLLKIERAGAHDDFFALGGHSLLATRLISRINNQLEVELLVRQIFDAPTVAGIAAAVEAERRADRRAAPPPIHAASHDAAPPISFAQGRLWFLDQMGAGAAYNMQLILGLTGPLDRALLEHSLSAIVSRQAALRTRFEVVDGMPCPIVEDGRPIDLEVVDRRDAGDGERLSAVQAVAEQAAERPFDLRRGPLFRVSLVRLADQEHALVFTIHHIVSDAWSLRVLHREIVAHYRALLECREAALPELPVQYTDFAAWQRAWLTGEVLSRQREYWKDKLGGGLPLLDLPVDRPRASPRTFRGASRSFTIDPPLAGALRALARAEGVTTAMLLLAAYQTLLARYSGQGDIALGSPIANRRHASVENLIGCFVNTLVLRSDLSDDPPFTELLRRVRTTSLEAYDHQDAPFEEVVGALDAERDPAQSPLFQATFAVQNVPDASGEIPGLAIRVIDPSVTLTRFDLELYLTEAGAGLSGALYYNTDVFDPGTAERIVRHYGVLLQSIAHGPDRSLSRLSLLTDDERQTMLVGWNDTTTDYPRDSCVHELFEAEARRAPDAVAVELGDRRLTYAELDRRANRLAHDLRRRGVGPGALAGICMERGVDLVVGLLGILKSGAAYVPMDPDQPAARIGRIVADAAPVVLLTQREMLSILPAFEGSIVCLDELGEASGAGDASDECPPSLTGPGDLAYVIYTSGSTGAPKGVCVPHRAVVRLVRDTNYMRLSPADGVAQASNASFDAATFEIWGALLNGARLIVVPRRDLLSPPLLSAHIRDARITVLWLTTALFNQLSDEAPAMFAPLDHLLVGGDALDPARIRAVLRSGRPRRLLNGYGPTENTTFSTWFEVLELPEHARSVPIGRPIANTTCYVLDAAQNPVPMGAPGELYLGGDGLATGYLNDPELTQRRFVPDPFSADRSARLYRTGDVVRYRPDGVLEFIGRKDHQVKLRGFRVELGEIEAALLRQDGVRDAVVLCREDTRGDKRLIAYVVPEPGVEPSTPAPLLREALATVLPDYMIPAAFVMLEALPLTANGKVDRAALPRPEPSHDPRSTLDVAPTTPTERRVAEIWAELLDVSITDAHENFFVLGGHSLMAMRVISRLERELGIDIPLQSLFDAPTVAGLSARVDLLTRARAGAGGEPIFAREPPPIRVERSGRLPLSFAQERLWFLEQLFEATEGHNMSLSSRLRGDLDVEALGAAFTRLVERHESLRTRFVAEGGTPLLHIDPAEPLHIAVEDPEALSGDPFAAAERAASIELWRPFALDREMPLRVRLWRVAEQGHLLLVVLHHIAADAWSLGVLARDLASLYRAAVRGGPADLPELPLQYADFAAWQRACLRGTELDRLLTYWTGALRGMVPLQLPLDRPRPARRSFAAATEHVMLDAALTSALEQLGRRAGGTLFMTLLAAFSVLLRRYARQDDIAVGSPIGNRGRPEFESAIGCFLNMLVLRTDTSGDPTFLELAGRVRAVTMGAFEHQALPFERLVGELVADRDLGQNPLFQVFFAVQNAPARPLDLPGLAVDTIALERRRTSFDLDVHVLPEDGGLRVLFLYATDLFEAATIRELGRAFRALLLAIVAAPEQPISTFALRESASLFDDVDAQAGADLPAAEPGCVHDLVEAQIARTPDATAAIHEGRPVTYAELGARARQLAARLAEAGAGRDVPIGLCVERGHDMLIGLLAILRAGSAYVPLDPALPEARLRTILEDSRAPILLTQERLLPVIPPFSGSIVFIDGEPREAAHGAREIRNPAGPESLAYVIYTSGSTGKPKGVEVNHASVVNFLRSMQSTPGLHAGDVLLAVTTLSFDIAGLELLLPLSVGGTVVIASKEVASDGRRLRALLETSGITAMQATPATWQMLIDAGWTGDLRLKMLCGGEALSRPLATELLARGGELWNMYGPTETTIWSAVSRVEREEGPVTLGAPIANTQLLVLDDELRAVPRGAPGELAIAGAGLARGYRDLPEMTAERFVGSPRPDEIPGRLYRTGDLVRRDARGLLCFLGRIDDQVKLRGFRIELGEIEAALTEHSGVSRAAALIREEPGEDRRLVAFWVARPGERPEPAALRDLLRKRLPDYMVPSAFVELEALPLSPAGKIDRRRLREIRPPVSAASEGATTWAAARSPTEEALAMAFQSVLRIDRAGAHDDFFQLGGHSLSATRLVSRIRDLLGVELPLSQVFETPTVAGLARSIDEQRRAAPREAPAPIRPIPRGGRLPLSFAQNRLWLIDQMGGGAGYHVRMEVGISGPLGAEALERSLNALVARHETLRTRFAIEGGSPHQIIDVPRELSLAHIDCTGMGAEDQERALQRFGAEEAGRPFDLERGPLLRAALLKLGDEEHVLSLSFHHIVADGWSFRVVLREIAAHYRALSLGDTVNLPALPIQYADFAAWQRGWMSGDALKGQLDHWKRQLAGGVAPLDLPADRPRPPVQSFAGAACRLVIDTSLRRALTALARERGATMAIVCLAAFQALLARYSGQHDIVVGSPIANRTQAKVEGLIGFFVNSVVMRADVSGDPRFTELLNQVRESSLSAYDNQDLPFEQLVDALEPRRDPSRTPIFQVVFAMHPIDEIEIEAAGVRMRERSPAVSVTRFDLELHLFEDPERLHATLVYSTALFDAATIERLSSHYQNLLTGIVARPDARISELPLLGADELHAAVSGWNSTAREIPGSGSVHHLIEAQARERPAATAVVHHERSLTYAELNARANQLARALRERGVRRDMLVGLSVRRGVDLAIGMLGVLKAGAAYVPLDPTYPTGRLALMLNDAEVSILVTEGALLASLPPHEASVLCLDTDRARLDSEPAHDLDLETSPDDLAYAIFTSGSTGTPKAALLQHRGLCNVAHEQARAFGVGPGARVLQFSSLGFDASTFDVVMALSHGATLFLGDREELLPGPDLVGFLRRHAIEIMTVPPTALTALPVEALPALATIAVAGEACPAELVARWAPGRRFFNLYGPTEATIWSTMAELRPGDAVHVGKPIANTEIYILDSHLNPVPVGVPGEICIGGVGLARAYYNRPQMTAERFVAHPFARGRRLYRTGDLGRRRPDGNIEFAGRIDHQVKLRGYRIELGEIESVLDRHPAVKRSVAIVREDVPGDRRLVAYVAADPGHAAREDGWEREHVSRWQTLYEQAYGEAPAPEDRTFNISSWNSSYTDEPIPADEMREWLDRTAEGILRTRPERVLEIGCGAGLVLFRIAPRCAEYLGTDLSRAALDYVERNLGALARGSADVRLEHRAADDLSGIPQGHFDTVVLNSVVQYFPSVEYLVRVIENAAEVLRPGGRILVGDVRSLPLLEAFHTSILLFRPSGELSVAQARRRVEQQMGQERELSIHPELFLALRDRVPAIRRVGIEPKRGRYDNELSRFRYDVVLSLDDEAPPPPEPHWIEWRRDLDLQALRDLLRSERHPRLGVRGISNRRTARYAEAAARLFQNPPPATVEELFTLSNTAGEGVDPDDLRELCRDVPYACAVTWAGGRADGSFDAVFRRRTGVESIIDPPAAIAAPPPRPRPWRAYGNEPLRGRALGELVPELRSHAAAALPEHMVPSAFVVLDALPVTPNGKLDRAALPPPDALRPELGETFAAPRTRVEETLAEVWMQTLNLERVGVHDDFFELGGDSILCIHVVARAREAGLYFSAGDLFQHPTVAELAKQLRTARAPQPEQGPIQGPAALTPIQHWFFEQDLVDAHHFNQSLLLAPAAAVNPAALRVALRHLVEHHDALRARYLREPDGWKQVIGPPPDDIALEVHDLSRVPLSERTQRIEIEASRLQASLDLSSGALLSAALFKASVAMGPQAAPNPGALQAPAGEPDALLLVIHHLAVDAVSWSPLLSDLARALEQIGAGAEVRLPPKTSSVASWSRALARLAGSAELAEQARRWLQLPWSEARALPVDRPSGANTAGAARVLEVSLSEGETRALLHDVPAAFGTDINAALLTALARAVADWTGHDRILLDLEGHGREELPGGLDVSRTVGWFTTIHPVLLAIAPGADAVTTLKSVHAQLAGYPGNGLPFGVARCLSADGALARALSALPRREILFNYLGQLDKTLGAGSAFRRIDAPIGPHRSPRGLRAHLLEINGGVSGGQLRMQWAWAGEIHDERTIEAVARRFVVELETLVEASSGEGPSQRKAPLEPGAFGWSAEDLEDIVYEIDEGS